MKLQHGQDRNKLVFAYDLTAITILFLLGIDLFFSWPVAYLTALPILSMYFAMIKTVKET